MPNILVVDDSSVDRILFKGLIEKLPDCSVIEADSGAVALDQIQTWDIDLIVTDMQMPNMDGLELVEHVRKNFPDIPIILATGHGSSQVAARALACGAAGYVPKAKLDELLLPTISNVISRMEADSNFAKLIDRSTDISFRFELENDPALIAPLIDLTTRMIAGVSPLCSVDRLRIGIAVEQALRNAMFRGNLELPGSVPVPFGDESANEYVTERIQSQLDNPELANRRIEVGVHITPAQFRCQVKDEGHGFNPAMIDDPLVGESGRGLVLIKSFMDEVEFNEQANEVTLVARWKNRARLDKSELVDSFGSLICTKSGRAIELTRIKYIVGASKTCHLVISEPSISPHHCLFVFRDGTWHVIDLNSEYGTTVNNKSVTQSKLKPDDVVGVGDYELKISYTANPLPA